MAVIVKDLGIASAYGYAKSKGYTGTEEEFAELMASYADVAQQAEAAAQDAEDAKDEAVTAKTDAQTAKTAAQAAQSASETASGAASTKASEAAQSAQAASGSATAAQTSATAAAGSAQTAQAAAQTATTKASEASSSASAASTAKTGAETARTGAQTAQTAAETAQENAEAAAASVSASAAQIEQNTADIGAIKNDLSEKADKTEALSAYIVETETGGIASFTDGADDVPVKDLTVAIEPVQSGSGDPSPSNVRPISGWTGANVNVTGVNAWDEDWEVGGYSETDGSKVVQATLRNTNPIPVKPSTAYYFKFGSGAKFRAVYLDADQHFISTSLVNVNNIYTTPVNCAYVNFNTDTAYGTTYNHDISVNYPSTDHDYHAYKGDVYSVDWTTEAGTVYGGTLDVTTGVLTVDFASMTVNGSANIFDGVSTATTADGELYVGYLNKNLMNAKKADEPVMLCDSYKYSILRTTAQLHLGEFNASGSYIRFVLTDQTITTEPAWRAYLAEHPMQLVYELETPQTYQLTAHEVSTILGQNNIFADTGNVTVQYRADTKLYIDKVLSA